MKDYSILFLKEEVSKQYFFKSGILYRFIKSYFHNQNRHDLSLQFDYITKSFQTTSMISHIKEYLTKHTSYHIQQLDTNLYNITDEFHYIALHVGEKHLKFRCESIQDAEKILFPSLRSYYPYLFIIDNKSHNYGWISPVLSTVTYTSNEQVLYSER